MRFNHRTRASMARMGMKPSPVGHQAYRDSAKAFMLRVMDKGRSWRERLAGTAQGCVGLFNAGLACAVL